MKEVEEMFGQEKISLEVAVGVFFDLLEKSSNFARSSVYLDERSASPTKQALRSILECGHKCDATYHFNFLF